MKKTSLLLVTLFGLATSAIAQKQVFLPDSIRCYDLDDDNSRWSWKRSAQTENLVFFWEKGFGHDLSNPPMLEGKPMKVDLENLKERIESFYAYYRDTLRFTLPGSKADKYKMMVMLNYSLDGTAYGGTYDNFIGALWVAPNRIQDKKLNCMAHELGHSFQLQIPADSVGDAWGGSGFYEMTSQWMLWLVNPDWLTDENYHFEAYSKAIHKAYLDGENIYRSPYVLQYWAMKRGKTCIADLYRAGKRGEDPVITYKRLYGLSQEQFCDEMIDACQHIVTLDLGHAWNETRRYACTFDTPMKPAATKGYYSPTDEVLPEDYGFSAIRLQPAKEGKKVSAIVKSDTPLRYAFVAVTADGETHYGTPVSTGKAAMKMPRGQKVEHLYLVVMGAPQEHKMLTWRNREPNRQYPYEVKFKGTELNSEF